VVEESFKSDRENKQFIYISNADTTRPDPFGAPDRTLFPFETATGKMLRSGNKGESLDSRGFGQQSVAGFGSADLPVFGRLIVIAKLNF
jgi:hypothetical protein